MSVKQLDQNRKYDLLESDRTNKWHFNHIPYTIDRTLADMHDERKEGEEHEID